MMAVLYTSDPHFGHVTIAEKWRPHGTVEAMNADMRARWNSVVGPTDTVLIFGDVAMGQIDESLAYVSTLNGRKVLRPGNHDRMHPAYKRKDKHGEPVYYTPEQRRLWADRYRNEGGLEVIGLEGDLYIGPATSKLSRLVATSHFPYQGDHTDEERYVEYRPADRGRLLVHGHVHQKWRVNGRQVNVGVDAWGGFPVSTSQLLHALEAAEQGVSLDVIPWTP